MTTDQHARFNRTHVRAWLVAAALAGVFVGAHAANSGNIGRAQITGNGNSNSVTQATTNSGGSTIPVSPSVGGWTQAGNYGFPTGATNPTMGHVVNGEFIVGGSGSGAVKYPFTANYTQQWKDLALGAITATATVGCSLLGGGLTTAACALTLPVALPWVYDWIKKAGGRVNPSTGQLERQDQNAMALTDGKDYQIQYTAALPASFYPTAQAACQQAAAKLDAATYGSNHWAFGSVTPNATYGPQCNLTRTTLAGAPAPDAAIGGFTTRTSTACQSGWWGNASGCSALNTTPYLPSSMNDIIPYMQGVTPDGRVVGDILGPGQGTIADVVPTVTGPASIQGPDTTTVNPDGSKQSARTTYNFSTAGNTVTNISNVTTTNNYNAAGAVTSTTTNTTTPVAATPATGTAAEKDQPTQCDKFPDTFGCGTGDVPDGKIPRDTKTITFAEESSFGGGSCPADRSFASVTMHQSVKVVDWTTYCSNALPIRGLVLLLATFAAFLIVMPGKEVRT